MKKKFLLACAAAIAMVTPATAYASEIILDFEGVGDFAAVNGFYNGGTDSQGNSGTNYGIQFTSDSLGIIDSDAGGGGNFANEPSADTILFFTSGGSAVMDVLAGFDTGFSFFYSAISYSGVVNVYSGLGATGDVLATLNLPTTGTNCTGDPTGAFCSWSPVGVGFAGTAYSVGFGGTVNQIGFDNITIGSATASVGAVPEPGTWAMMLIGFGGIGVALRRRRAGSSPTLQLA